MLFVLCCVLLLLVLCFVCFVLCFVFVAALCCVLSLGGVFVPLFFGLICFVFRFQEMRFLPHKYENAMSKKCDPP